LLQDLQQEVRIVGVTESLPLARRSLEKGDVDAVAVVPADANSFIERGEQIPLHVLLGEIDPVRRNYAHSYLRDQIAVLNQRAVATALGQARGGVADVAATTEQARVHLNEIRAASEPGQAGSSLDRLRETVTGIAPSAAGEAAAGAALAIPGLAGAVDAPSLEQATGELQAGIDALDARLAAGSTGSESEAEIQRIEAALSAIDDSTAGLAAVDPNVLSAPFVLQMEDVTPVTPGFTAFYSPGVLALLVHHLAITLAALTLARMRLLRVIEVLRVAPVRTFEIVLGNYLSYAVLCGLAAAGLMAMLVFGLDVPVIGSYAYVALVLGLLIFSALGVGFLASQLSSSVQQAAQIAMLLLLAAVFFGGFAFSLDRIEWPFRAISHMLPATYAIRALQDVMLRGFEPRLTDITVLASTGAVLLIVNVVLLRRTMRPS
jgi:ABC-2 type transport system permease protein